MAKEQDTSNRAVQPVVTRRTTLAAAAALTLPATQASADDTIAALIARVTEKNAAFMRGDMQRWSDLVPIASDFTLFQPFGGPATRGFDKGPERLAAMSRYFRNGTCGTEVVQTYASDDMIVLATVERQTGEVGDLPLQNWSLRVTEVWRRSSSEWQLAHRHADPLVERRSLAETADLARARLTKK